MALLTKKGRGSLPEGVVKLSEEEALNHQKNIIKNWPSKFDVFFLQNSPFIAGAVSTVTGGVILYHLKNFFNLKFAVFGLSFVPGAAFPGIFSMFTTEVGLTDEILLMKIKCAVCHQLKYGCVQAFGGLLFPAAYGVTTMAMFAQIMKSYPFPDMVRNPKAVWREYGRALMSGAKKYQYLGLLQAAVILLLPMMQSKEFHNVMLKLKAEEDDDDSTELNLQA